MEEVITENKERFLKRYKSQRARRHCDELFSALVIMVGRLLDCYFAVCSFRSSSLLSLSVTECRYSLLR